MEDNEKINIKKTRKYSKMANGLIHLGVEGNETIGFPYYVDFVSASLLVVPKIINT